MKYQHLMWIVWPAFLTSGATSAVVFAMIDPLDVIVLGTLQLERNTLYALGFFLFWGMAALSSALTLLMAPPRARLKSPAELLT